MIPLTQAAILQAAAQHLMAQYGRHPETVAAIWQAIDAAQVEHDARTAALAAVFAVHGPNVQEVAA